MLGLVAMFGVQDPIKVQKQNSHSDTSEGILEDGKLMGKKMSKLRVIFNPWCAACWGAVSFVSPQ
jgi:hypothetical protein